MSMAWRRKNTNCPSLTMNYATKSIWAQSKFRVAVLGVILQIVHMPRIHWLCTWAFPMALVKRNVLGITSPYNPLSHNHAGFNN